MVMGFKTTEFIQIPQEENAKADTLARAAASGDPEAETPGDARGPKGSLIGAPVVAAVDPSPAEIEEGLE
ncbi:hypothetical protein Nepgr_021499 [Nepenthes gracilis]|uniref:Uncharacterized protein n=1 Tax=Nepenthes gracilis TaxID=150966 RepID=A0AAD3SY84_NEPGR|nr:hypothetical protein Nepgr_021499 [Nepenthes gracilis]